jgi:hypothetical protein
MLDLTIDAADASGLDEHFVAIIGNKTSNNDETVVSYIETVLHVNRIAVLFMFSSLSLSLSPRFLSLNH